MEAIPVVATRMAKDGLAADAACTAEHIALVGREAWQRDLDLAQFGGYVPGRDDTRDKRLRFMAGQAAERLRGKAPAKDVAAYLGEHLEESGR